VTGTEQPTSWFEMPTASSQLTYLVTVSRAHLLPAQMLLITLREVTTAPVVVVGNLEPDEADLLRALGATYIDERSVDLDGRFPELKWQEKLTRQAGWYRQMLLRLSIDRYVDAEHVVILDSEVFAFDNWDERRFFDPATGRPRCFYWVPHVRKPEWDYKMYRGAAYLLEGVPGCDGVMDYASSDAFRRHISGVVLFSTSNLRHLWQLLETSIDLPSRLDRLFNDEPDLLFCDHDLYGIAVDLGLFASVVPPVLHGNLLGWYDNHSDPVFEQFRDGAMWSMCQRYAEYPSASDYYAFMAGTAARLGRTLPTQRYWNPVDADLVDDEPPSTGNGIEYFDRYRRQLDHTFRSRFTSMRAALEHLQSLGRPPVIVEIGTLRDTTRGGGHSTYKFAEFCSRNGGVLHTVDISAEAIAHSRRAVANFQPWVQFHVCDSEDFLREFPGSVDLLYLDGFDALSGQEEDASRKQLGEASAALSKVAPDGAVLLDDVAIPEGGKALYSSEFLASNGFELVVDAYQHLFLRQQSGALQTPSVPASKRGFRGQLQRRVTRWIHGE
jgi:Methyltransferase domain